jgi:hypothetical protein
VLSDIEVIDGAIELVSRDGGWCQGAFCKDTHGRQVTFMGSKQAEGISFCLEGAIGHVSGYRHTHTFEQTEQYHRLLDAIDQQVFHEGEAYGVACFNDLPTTTQEDAVLALKKTRSYLEEQG